MFNYYTFLFKRTGEAWGATMQFLARSEDEAYECALNWADANEYADFRMM